MKLIFEHNQKTYHCDLSEPLSIAIHLDFDGPQPNHFGVDKARRQAVEMGPFVGSTSRGGSCNVDTIVMVPHCNGTHTESVGHIVDDEVFVAQQALESCYPAVVVSLPTTRASQTKESYRPELDPADAVVTRTALDEAIDRWTTFNAPALVIRTLPNDRRKSRWVYNKNDPPPFFTVEAIERINELDVAHLLVDFPSLDRMYDEGLLTCHHLYWNVPEKTHRMTAETKRHKTITEMVMIPDTIEDGFYLLNLQIPAFFCDAAPSRPILFATREMK